MYDDDDAARHSFPAEFSCSSNIETAKNRWRNFRKTGGKSGLKSAKNGAKISIKKCAPKSAILRTVFHSFHSVM